MLVNFDHAGETLDAKRWPELSRFMAAMHARPSFSACIESERNFLARQLAA